MLTTNRLSVAIEELACFFLPHCRDQSTIGELRDMASDPKQWREARGLFRRIRAKSLQAGDAQDQLLLSQYAFEEICAKTLYNMADPHPGYTAGYPRFDYDAPFWVLPFAVRFAHRLGLKGLPCGSCLLRIDDEGPGPVADRPDD